MNTITIEFSHPDALSPKYKFGDSVAVTNDCQPEAWAIGKVVGLNLEEILGTRWLYTVKLDSPLGYTEEYEEDKLVLESEISTLQIEWNQGKAAWVQESQVSNLTETETRPSAL